MTLPSTGIITAAMVNVELNRAATATFNLNDPAVRALAGKPSGAISFADLRGKSSEIVKYVTASGAGPDTLKNLFTAAEWASDTKKRVVINAGVEIGGNGWGYALAISDHASGQAGSFAGELTLQNHGYISGRGGGADGGAGATAFLANLLGRNGQKIILNNQGVIRGGGGGGGNGGRGGPGFYDAWQYTEWRGDGNNRWRQKIYSPVIDKVDLYWDGQILNQRNGDYKAPYAIQIGDRYYESGNLYGGDSTTNNYKIRYRWSQRFWTEGGWGGGGGQGQGYGQGNTGPGGGTGGGTNAGSGGNGGWGAEYGNRGADGARGNAGNNGEGAWGTAGGAAGAAIQGWGNVHSIYNGTLLGPLT